MQISDNPLQLALCDSGLVRHGPTALSLSLFGSHGEGHGVTSSLLNQRIRNALEQMSHMNVLTWWTLTYSARFTYSSRALRRLYF